MRKKTYKKKIYSLVVALAVVVGGYITTQLNQPESVQNIEDIPAYKNKPYVELNDGKPYFTEKDLTTKSFEKYSPLDSLGRCGVAYANVSKKTMPTEKRGSIGQVKPSGWQTIKYDFTKGMLYFENMVADYVKETNNHVLYRVTPVYEGDNLVADGVIMEAMSVEDEGLDIEFNVFVYNVQPGVNINYANGKSHLAKEK